MKAQINTFSNIHELTELLNESHFSDDSKLLIQIFSAFADIAYINQIQLLFQSQFPLAVLIGSTTDGIIASDMVHADNTSLVVFTYFNNTTLQSVLIEHDVTYQDAYITGKIIASKIVQNDTKVIITFADGIHTNGEEYINGLSSLNPHIIISGGLSGDNGQLQKTYVFDKKFVSSNGAIAVALNSQTLQATTDYSFNWTPIGKYLQVTKALKNRVYEIDGMPAVDIYAKYLGQDVAKHLPLIGIEFPLILERDGVLIGRAVLLRHDDDSLTFAGNIHEGDRVRFGIGNVEMILRSGSYHARHIAETSKFQTEAIFIYSCMARRRFMGHYIEKELKPFAQEALTAGFFTYGEFFHSQGKNQLLNETMTILALSESDQISHKVNDYAMVEENHFGVNPLHAISHLSNTVSHELEELNNTLETRIAENKNYIYKQAYFDKLTRLPNRLKLIQDLPDQIGKTLILLNIDDFTLINDFYGHYVGDSVLKHVASILIELFKNKDTLIYKLPSDEFILLLHQELDIAALKQQIEFILKHVAKNHMPYEDHSIHITLTAAASLVNRSGTGLVHADMTLKQAKQSHKNYLIYDDTLRLTKNYETNLKMAHAIRYGIDEDTFIPYFQPIYDVRTQKIIKYESLVRLKQKDNTILSPFAFLSIAQKIKLYPQITRIMIEKTFLYFQNKSMDFTVNLAFDDILNPETRAYILHKLATYSAAKQLTFEILETQQLENEPDIKQFIHDARQFGVKFAIDDFGSGFANFEHMTKIDADYIKIDGSLIKNIDSDANARLVVETIVIFAKKLKMKTVAEFVHSKEVFDIVKELEIDYAQGYYLGKPLDSVIS